LSAPETLLCTRAPEKNCDDATHGRHHSGCLPITTTQANDAVETDVTYQAFDARTNRVLGEFPTLAAAQEAIGEQDDFFVMRCDEGESPELVWET
jgi:hypothetical protein